MAEHIKREAAIRVICDCCVVCADIECCDYAKGSYGGCKEIEGLRAIPAADVVKVVRCKNCIHCVMEDENERWCLGWGSPARRVAPDSYCSRGIGKGGKR